MTLTPIPPRKSLNKAYLKEKVTRTDIELFKKNLIEFVDGINEKESEEYVKNLVTKFLYDTYYHGKNQINTKGRIDLAIYEDKKPVVIVEAKRPSSSDMVSDENLNTKAMHELMLYYLQERVDHGNIDIKHLIITNTFEWFVFDASVFDSLFYKNGRLMKEFIEWKTGQKARSDRDLFYSDIAKPFLISLNEEIKFTYFDLREILKYAKNNNPKDDTKLIDPFKILSPAHLLKQPFANDSNSLDTKFYSELLHIIGLEEKKDGGKKIIQRKENPESGSIIENTINILIVEDRLHRLPKAGADFGNSNDERLFSVALELCITWINRILFLKLLEGQLVKYHSDDKRFRFLDFKTISNYDELNKLFFQVLARKLSERTGSTHEKFRHVPYLNSSLFDITQLEADSIRINSLDDGLKLKLANATILKTEHGKKREGEVPALQYLLEFLDAYDFSSEGKEEIQEENKSLINASVLGLIFEKINGYKDGSYFTPGFITMYMCRETIRRAVVKKFNEAKNWNVQEFEQLYNKVDDVKEANDIINTLKICDPAVGSGHFLVSALNEIIAIKSELGILADHKGNRLREYTVEVVNDELIISVDQEDFFEYQPGNKVRQRVQEAFFHEKQTIIENCLFGVDINPNSVKICRLRLWIELLKNAYYTAESKYTELETLPNIDINIKQGNSLISRFSFDADLSKALKSIKYNINDYRAFVNSYKNATDKEEKRGFETLINQIKSEFRTEIGKNDPKILRKNKLAGDLYNLLNQAHFFEPSEKEKDERRNKKEKLEVEITKISAEIEEIKNSAIYKDAFEWRFEFPEALDGDGKFIGFDVVIGNPPYISHDKIVNKEILKVGYRVFEPFTDLYSYFIEAGIRIIKTGGELSFITSNSFLRAEYGKPLRQFLLETGNIISILNLEDAQIFQDATVNTCILGFENVVSNKKVLVVSSTYNLQSDFNEFINSVSFKYNQSDLGFENWNLPSPEKLSIRKKIRKDHKILDDYGTQINLGIATGANDVFLLTRDKYEEFIRKDPNNKSILKPILRGRDIQRYSYDFPDLWLILSRNEINVEKEYPTIYSYLESVGEAFKNRGARGKHWTNLRACSFFDDFKKEKIIWIELSDKNRFSLCEDEIYLLNTAYFLIPPKELSSKFLLGILNSRLIHFYLNLIANTSGVGTTRWFHVYVKQLPIPLASKAVQESIGEIVSRIIKEKQKDKDSDTRDLESKVDELVYRLYGLTDEDITVVEEN